MSGRLCHGQDHEGMQTPFEARKKIEQQHNSEIKKTMSRWTSSWQKDKEVSPSFKAWTNCQKKSRQKPEQKSRQKSK